MTLWFWHGFTEDSLICFRQTFWDLWNETWHFVALTMLWMWQSLPDAAASLAQGASGNNTTSQCTTVILFLGCNAQGNQCFDIRFRSLCITISRTNIIWRWCSNVIWDRLPTVQHSINGEQVWRDCGAEKPNIFWGSHPAETQDWACFRKYWFSFSHDCPSLDCFLLKATSNMHCSATQYQGINKASWEENLP